MSEVKTNKLTGTSTAGSILVTGEGNSTTTNLQQGLAKAWHNVSSDGATVNDSLNISSYTDTGTGVGSHNLSSAFGNVNYATMTKILFDSAAGNSHRTIYTSTQTTTLWTEETYNLNTSAALVAEDRARLAVAFGDLA